MNTKVKYSSCCKLLHIKYTAQRTCVINWKAIVSERWPHFNLNLHYILSDEVSNERRGSYERFTNLDCISRFNLSVFTSSPQMHKWWTDQFSCNRQVSDKSWFSNFIGWLLSSVVGFILISDQINLHNNFVWEANQLTWSYRDWFGFYLM